MLLPLSRTRTEVSAEPAARRADGARSTRREPAAGALPGVAGIPAVSAFANTGSSSRVWPACWQKTKDVRA